MVDIAYLVNTADGTAGGTTFFGKKLALDVFRGVLGQRDAGKAALLAAVMDEAVFADVKVTSACAAAPLVRLAVGDGFLKVIKPAIATARHGANGVPHLALRFTERLELT